MHIKIAKILFILMFYYQGWYQDVYVPIPRMLLILGAPMMLMLVFHCFKTRQNIHKALSIEVGLWFLFTITSYVSGVFIADNLSLFISSVFTLFQVMLVLTAIFIIADHDQSIDFFIKIYIGLALLCAATMIFTGDEFSGGRMSIGEKNPNTLGLLLCSGVFCILFLLDIKKKLNPILSVSTIILFLYVIILTGSRKSFLAAVALIVFWLLVVLPNSLRNVSTTRKFAIVSILLITCVIAYFVAAPLINDAVLFARLDTLFTEGDEIRAGLIAEGFQFFSENPIFGIGYDQYRELSSSKTYSHSTYAEVFSCTGLVGAILYFSVYLIIFYKLLKIIIIKKESETSQRALKVLSLMVVLVFLAIGVIHYYSLNSMVMFGIIVAFCNLALKAKKEQENEYKESAKVIQQKTQIIDT